MANKDYIEKASELFMTMGFKSVTMDDIANALSVSKKTLYENFSSKENLIEAVLEFRFNEVKIIFSEIMDKELNSIEEMISFKSYINEKYNTPQQAMCNFQLQKYYGKLHQEVYMKQHDKIAKLISLNFQRGKEQELYRKEIIPEIYSDLFMKVENAISKISTAIEYSEDAFKLIDIYFDTFIRGIITEKGLKIYKKLIQN